MDNQMTNQDIDALVATKVMGWDYIPGDKYTMSSHCWMDAERHIQFDRWNPSESISDAFLVVEKMRDSVFELTREKDGNYTAAFYREAYHDPLGCASAETAPLAISKAALEAAQEAAKEKP